MSCNLFEIAYPWLHYHMTILWSMHRKQLPNIVIKTHESGDMNKQNSCTNHIWSCQTSDRQQKSVRLYKPTQQLLAKWSQYMTNFKNILKTQTHRWQVRMELNISLSPGCYGQYHCRCYHCECYQYGHYHFCHNCRTWMLLLSLLHTVQDIGHCTTIVATALHILT